MKDDKVVSQIRIIKQKIKDGTIREDESKILIKIIYTSEYVSQLLDSDFVSCCYLLHFFIQFLFYLLPDIFF